MVSVANRKLRESVMPAPRSLGSHETPKADGLFGGILAAALPAGATARDGLAHSCSERVSVRDLRAKTLVDLF